MTFLAKWEPQLLSVLRIVAGLLFLEHGMTKLFHFPHVAMFDGPLTPMIIAAGAIEFIGGLLITIGLFTRIAAFICSGEMAVAYWMVHFTRGGPFPVINGGEGAILFCFVFLFLAAAGAGPWSLDRK
jgi:putative oxidoreductase